MSLSVCVWVLPDLPFEEYSLPLPVQTEPVLGVFPFLSKLVIEYRITL